MFLLASLAWSATFGKLGTKGTNVVGSNGDPVILRGVSLGWDTWWSRFYTADSVNHLVNDFHANIIRAAIGIEPEGGWLEQPNAAYQHLYTVADACISKGVYVILDFHAHKVHTTEAQNFFRTVANRYKGNQYVIYEIFNEPESATWSQIKQYANSVISTIRGIDSSGLILVPNAQWDQKPEEPANDPLTGDNLAYVVHFYAGSHGASLRNSVKTAAAKIPIFVSEFGGMNSDGDGAIATSELNSWISTLEDLKISYVAWCIEAKAESCSILPVSGSWSQLTNWGNIVKQLITGKQ
jgi:endoglucanase